MVVPRKTSMDFSRGDASGNEEDAADGDDIRLSPAGYSVGEGLCVGRAPGCNAGGLLEPLQNGRMYSFFYPHYLVRFEVPNAIPGRCFCNRKAWSAQLDALGVNGAESQPRPRADRDQRRAVGQRQ